MDNELTIREADESDLEAMVNLWIEFIDFHKEFDMYFTRSNDGHEESKKIIADRISDDNSYILVAGKKGEIIGFSTAAISKDPPIFATTEYGVIMSFAITAKHHRKGIGEKMLKKVID